GPPRTLTRSGLRLTKRGIGRPLLGPVPTSPAARAVAAQISAAIKARAVTGARRTIRQLRLEFTGSGRRKITLPMCSRARRDGGDAGLCLHTSICYRGIPTRVRNASVRHGG